MNKIAYLQRLKTFGFSFYNDTLTINKKYKKEDINNCKLCNLYKVKKQYYKTNLTKSNIFILSSYNLDYEDVENLNDILKNSIGLTLKNIYFSSVVKCSNKYSKEDMNKCFNYFLNEFIDSNANILILLGENLKNLLKLEKNLIGEKIFYKINNKTIKVLLNYDFDFIKKNPSLKMDFISNLNKIKEDL